MERQRIYLLALGLTLTLFCSGFAIGADPPDLVSYLAEIRTSSVSEDAKSQLTMVASYLTGQIVLQHQKDPESGRYQPSYRSATCPNPKADPVEVRKWQESLQAKIDAQFVNLRKLADRDHSGFVSTVEGSAFRTLVEFGYLAAQVQTDGGSDFAALKRAAGIDDAALRANVALYDALAKSATAVEIGGLPQVKPFK